MKKLQDGSLDPYHMLTHRIDIEDMEEAYKRFDAREKGIQKIYVQTKFSQPPAPGAPQLTRWAK